MTKQVFKSVVSSKGQVVLPKQLRDQLGLQQGMTVEFHHEDGKVTLHAAEGLAAPRRKITKIEFLAGRIKWDMPFPTDKEIEQGILKEAARRYREEIR